MALTIVFGVLVIGGICLLSLGGLELWSASCQLTRASNTTMLRASIYAVLLALVVIAVWQSFQAANVTVDQRQTLWPRSSGWPIGS